MSTLRLTPLIDHPLESTKELRGPTFSATGSPTYSTAKFGNGIVCDNTANYLTASYVIPTYPLDNCFFQFVWKPNNNWNTNDGTFPRLFSIAKTTNNQNELIVVKRFNGSGVNNEWNIRIRTSNVTRSDYNFTPTTQFSSGDNLTVTVVLESGAAANNKIKLYIDDVTQVFSSTSADTAWSVTDAWTFYPGKWQVNATTADADGVIDNFKITDELATSFEYINYERFDYSKKRRR